MPLHERDKIRSELLGSVCASTDLSQVMPEHEYDPRHAYEEAGGFTY